MVRELSVPAAVVLSGYRSPLYDELYGDWWSVEISASTQQGATGPRSGDRTEVLWSNRPLAATEAFPIFQQALPAPSDSWMEVAL